MHLNHEIMGNGFTCSECRANYNYGFNYCPDCGHKHGNLYPVKGRKSVFGMLGFEMRALRDVFRKSYYSMFNFRSKEAKERMEKELLKNHIGKIEEK